jgi:hypothetical protein
MIRAKEFPKRFGKPIDFPKRFGYNENNQPKRFEWSLHSISAKMVTPTLQKFRILAFESVGGGITSADRRCLKKSQASCVPGCD